DPLSSCYGGSVGLQQEPEGRLKQAQAIMFPVDGQRLADAPRSGAQQSRHGLPATLLHFLHTPYRLQCADEHCAAGPADDIETPVDAVGAVDIGMSRGPEHRTVPLRRPSETVRGRIVRLIGLSLHDDATDTAES